MPLKYHTFYYYNFYKFFFKLKKNNIHYILYPPQKKTQNIFCLVLKQVAFLFILK